MNHPEYAQFIYVDTANELEELTAELEKADRIALDTEADSLHHYYAKVCLIQISFDGRNYIIDPLSAIDLSVFLKTLSNKPIILHGADYDLRMLRNSFGFRPQRDVFDTMLAAQLLGYTEFGLTPLVQRYFNVTLGNLGKKTDWSHRPLTPAQLQYACEDTHYLGTLADRLLAELQVKGREQWHRESCERIVMATQLDKPRDFDRLWRIKGVHLLDRPQMALLREIWHWRENEAQQADIPPFKVIGNQKILELVLWVSQYPDAPLREGPKLPRNCVGSRLKYLEKAIHKAQYLPPSEWPQSIRTPKPPPPAPNCKHQTELLIRECAEMAEALEITPSVLATRAALTAVTHHRPQSIKEVMACSSMMHWQAELMWPAIQRVLGNRETPS